MTVTKMLLDKVQFWRKEANQQALILPFMVKIDHPMIQQNIHVDVMNDSYDDYSQQSGTYKVLGETEDGNSYIIRYRVSWVHDNGMLATVAKNICTPVSQNGGYQLAIKPLSIVLSPRLEGR